MLTSHEQRADILRVCISRGEEEVTMLTATVDDLLGWEPCSRWTEDCIRNVAGKKERWSALEVLDLPILPEEKLWIVLRPELIPEPLLHELACRFAEQVLPIWESRYPEDQRLRLAIEAKRAWIRGEISRGELDAAGSAAWSARAVAEAVARAAARAVAWAAADAAAWAWSAAWEAARDSAFAAARSAAIAETRVRQVAIVRKLIEVRATEFEICA